MFGPEPPTHFGSVHLLGVRKKVAASMPAAQYSLIGQSRWIWSARCAWQESMTVSCLHTQRHFQALQCAAWQI